MAEIGSRGSKFSNEDMEERPFNGERDDGFPQNIDSDSVEPEEQVVGQIDNVCLGGKVTKEILVLGSGFWMPGNQFKTYCSYIMYFYDHTVIESTHGKIVPIILNDKQWPEGLWFGLGKMRKGEKSKIKIKKSYGWGSSLDPELLWTPESCKEGEMNTWIKTKGLIYEITLHDWDIWDDLEHDGNIVKIVT